MTFVGRFHPNAADAIADLVALLSQILVFVLGDGLGVTQGMGRQGAVGIVPQDVHIHRGSLQAQVLLTKSQHLLRRETNRQGGAVAVLAHATLAAAVQRIGRQLHQIGQTITQRWPFSITDQTRLDVEGVRELAAGEHLAAAIQQAAPNRGARHQADAVLISCHLVISAMEQLQPHQSSTNGTKQGQQQQQDHRRLLSHAAVAGIAAVTETGHGSSTSSS